MVNTSMVNTSYGLRNICLPVAGAVSPSGKGYESYHDLAVAR